MNNIGVIIGREYKERVYKKSFIITTILMPVLLLLLSVAPALIMRYGGTTKRNFAVIDKSGIIAQKLVSNNDVEFTLTEASLQDALKANYEDDNYGVLYIGENILTDTNDAKLYTNSSSSITIEANISKQIEKIIETERLKKYDIENLDKILEQVKASVHLTTFRNEKEKESTASSSAASSVVGMVLGFILYFFLVIYGSIVMTSVIEEKNSRVLDVMISTVKPFQMMMGKILGVAAVAATQIAIWGIIIVVIASVVIPSVMPSTLMENVKAVQDGADIQALVAQCGAQGVELDTDMLTAMASVTDTGYISMILSTLFLFLIGGFLLYAALYAAIGASVDQAQDAQQLTIIITVPIIVAFVVLMMIMQDPNSQIVYWCSFIPFTSPIVMMGRIPAGIPTGEIITSLVLLYATFIGAVWISGKIYRIGVSMHGVKPSLKDLWRWLRY